MTALLRSELFKLRTTRQLPGLFLAMTALVVLVVSVHGAGLPARSLQDESRQITSVFGWGEVFGVLMAAILGAISFTSEVRFGTIRPTFLHTPQRQNVVIAKIGASGLIGVGFGLASGAVATATGLAILTLRGIEVYVEPADLTRLILGGALAAAFWAAIGAGLGAIVREQVPVLVGIAVWLLLVENLLLGDIAGGSDPGRYFPGFAGKSVAGLDRDDLLGAPLGVILLMLYATGIGALACRSTVRRDFS